MTDAAVESGGVCFNKFHILLAPFTAFGHLIPLLELAKRLSKHHCCTIALSDSLLRLAKSRDLLDHGESALIKFIGLKDGYIYEKLDKHWDFMKIHGLNSSAVATLIDNIPTRNSGSSAFDLPSLTDQALEPVDVIITDIFIGQTIANSHQRGIPHYLFQTAAAACIPIYLLINEQTPVYPDDEDPNGFLKYLQGNTALDEKIGTPKEMKDHFAPITKEFPLCSGIIINSIRSFEEEAVGRIAKDPLGQSLKLFFVGPLLPSQENLIQKELSVDLEEWLDSKSNNSFVYASLGTVGQPPPNTILEIGRGLLLLQKPFILSLKESDREHLPKAIKDQLSNPNDFADRSFLVLPWVPQRQVLNHPACGVFVTHGGWNSTLEGLSSGVPFVCWPMFGDNLLDAQLLVKQGVAEMMEGTGLKPVRNVLGEELADAVRKVTGWSGTETSKYRKAAEDYRKKIKEEIIKGNGDCSTDFLSLLNSIVDTNYK